MKGRNSCAPCLETDDAELPSPSPEAAVLALKTCSVLAYSESTLLRLPWSGIEYKDKPLTNSISLGFPEEPTSFRGRIQWTVSCPGGRLVGSYERSVFRALEWIALGGSVALGFPFENPLVVHPRDICDRLCWKVTQAEFHAIDRALKNLGQVRIRRLTPGKPGTSPVTQSLGLLRSAPQSTVRRITATHGCPNYLIHFDDFFVNSVNTGGIRPVNWSLWMALENPVARRLLEILDFEFSREGSPNLARVEFESLSSLLPLSRAIPLQQRRNFFEEAHAVLIREGYLDRVEAGISRGQHEFTYHAGPALGAMSHLLKSTMGSHSSQSPLRHALDRPSLPGKSRRLASLSDARADGARASG